MIVPSSIGHMYRTFPCNDRSIKYWSHVPDFHLRWLFHQVLATCTVSVGTFATIYTHQTTKAVAFDWDWDRGRPGWQSSGYNVLCNIHLLCEHLPASECRPIVCILDTGAGRALPAHPATTAHLIFSHDQRLVDCTTLRLASPPPAAPPPPPPRHTHRVPQSSCKA